MPSSIERTFDVIKATHPANALFTLEAQRPVWLDRPVRNWMWTPGAQLDQGQEGHCVGFGSWGEALATPVPVMVWGDHDERAHVAFHLAQDLDEIPGTDYEGTTLTGGGNAMRKLKYLDSYFWLKNAFQVAVAIGRSGPVVVGIPWLAGMDQVQGPDDYFQVSGRLRGWHCVLLYGVQGVRSSTNWDIKDLWFPVRNSWAGACNGRLWASDLDSMFTEGADAWVGVGRHYSGAWKVQ